METKFHVTTGTEEINAAAREAAEVWHGAGKGRSRPDKTVLDHHAERVAERIIEANSIRNRIAEMLVKMDGPSPRTTAGEKEDEGQAGTLGRLEYLIDGLERIHEYISVDVERLEELL